MDPNERSAHEPEEQHVREAAPAELATEEAVADLTAEPPDPTAGEDAVAGRRPDGPPA